MMTDSYTTLRYLDPAERWTDALPIGNGRLGAMVFGGIGTDRFQLNETTCWSGAPSSPVIPDGPAVVRQAREALAGGDVRAAEEWLARLQGGHTQSYQPLADLRLFDDADARQVTGYQRCLDLRSAVASHSWRTPTARVSQEAWISHASQALVIRRRIRVAGTSTLRIALDSPHPGAVASPVDGGLDLIVRMPADVPPDGPVNYDGTSVTAAVGLRVLSGGLLIPDGDRLRLDGADEIMLVLCVVTDYADPYTAPHGDVAALRHTLGERLRALSGALVRDGGYPALRAAHEREHASLFTRVGLRLGPSSPGEPLDTPSRVAAPDLGPDSGPDPGLAALQFQYGRYLLITSSRPGGLPANLQGLWNQHVRPPWNSDYTTNINVEMNYWPAEVTGLSECHQPLFDWLTHARRRTARSLYDAAGWTLHHNSDAWCFALPTGTGGDDACWSFWPLAGAWLSLHAAQHYDYTLDRHFLAAKGWPVLRGAAEFCLDWLIELPDGTWGTSPSTSPENHFVAPDGKPAAVSVSTTSDLVLIRELLRSVIRLAPHLPRRDAGDEKLVSRAVEALDRLPAPRVLADGRLAEWSSDLTDAEPEHRHTSHLIGIYPGDSSLTPSLIAAARKTLDARGPESTGWSLAWRIALRARLRDAEGAAAAVRTFLRSAEPDRTTDFGQSDPSGRPVSGGQADPSGRPVSGAQVASSGQAAAGGEPLSGGDPFSGDEPLSGAPGGGDVPPIEDIWGSDDRSGVYRNLFCAHPPFQIDGNFGFTAGVAEMLMQSHESTADETVIDLLPALPADWDEGAFAGLRARGGVTVDASWAHGQVQDVRLLSDTARRVTVRTGEHRIEVTARPRTAVRLQIGD